MQGVPKVLEGVKLDLSGEKFRRNVRNKKSISFRYGTSADFFSKGQKTVGGGGVGCIGLSHPLISSLSGQIQKFVLNFIICVNTLSIDNKQ